MLSLSLSHTLTLDDATRHKNNLISLLANLFQMKTEENAITSPSLYLAVNLSFIPTPTYLPGNKVQIRLKNARHF